jgi:hypothetical protein
MKDDFTEGVTELTRRFAWKDHFESNPAQGKGAPYDPKFYLKTGSWPTPNDKHNNTNKIMAIRNKVIKELGNHAIIQESANAFEDNIDPIELAAAKRIIGEGTWAVLPSDKNLGPVVMLRSTYTAMLKKHFDATAFQSIFIAEQQEAWLAINPEGQSTDTDVQTAVEAVYKGSQKCKQDLLSQLIIKATRIAKQFPEVATKLKEWREEHPLTHKIQAATKYLKTMYPGMKATGNSKQKTKKAPKQKTANGNNTTATSDSPYAIPQIYGFPKVHKSKLALRNITPQVKSATEPLAKAITALMMCLTKASPWCWMDPNTVRRKIEQLTVPVEDRPDFKLFLFDIVSMYPNIPQREAIEVIVEFIRGIYNLIGPDVSDKVASIVQQGLQLILQECYVANGMDVYKAKVKGIPMGTAVAPVVAVTFLMHLYKIAIRKATKEGKFSLKDDLFGMYLDDGTWGTTLPTEECIAIITEMLRYGPEEGATLEFTHEVLQANTEKTSGPVLDMLLMLDDHFMATGKISFKLYAKPMSAHDYIPPSSNHPKHTYEGVVKGECIRGLRNASRAELYEDNKEQLKGWFIHRGYQPTMINTQFKSIPYSQRNEYIAPKPLKDNFWVPEGVQQELGSKSILALPYSKSISHRATKAIKAIVTEQDWPSSIGLASGDLTLAWRRGRSIQDTLTKQKVQDEQHAAQLYSAATAKRPPKQLFDNIKKEAKRQQNPIIRGFKC